MSISKTWILGGASGRMITTTDGYVGDGFIADVDTKEHAELIVRAVNAYAQQQAVIKVAKELLEWRAWASLGGNAKLAIDLDKTS
jgi:pyridoxal biosynthesis lyase PdxS